MKCIVIQTSPERINAEPVTNEDGTPHIYATISEARAELRANGYSYNRANQRYYIKSTEYRAYILRADSEEYAEIIEQAEQEAAPEYIEPEHIQTVSGHKIYRSTDPVTGENVFTVAGRDFWELAEARYFAQCNPAEQAEPAKHHDDHAAELAAVEAAAPEALASEGNPEDAVSLIAYTAFACINDGATPDTYDDNDMEQLERLMGYASEIVRRDGPAHGIQWTPYQRYELEAFLGEPDDYDVDAIEAEATRFTADGARVWTAFGDDLAAIAERHELYAYAPAI